MKKLISVFVALIMLLSIFSISAFAEGTSATTDVYVTISKAGTLVLSQEKITVTDRNSDGKFDIDEALYCAHEAKYEGGAAAGYGSAYTAYGLSLTELWGDTGGSFGYYVNNASAWSLADEVKDGDYINAFVYTDTTSWSDKYSFFDKNTATLTAEEEITLTLSAAGYDASYNPITVPVNNAAITLNGEATEYKTDENGKVTVKISKSGTYIVSATSATEILVPPVLTLTVNAKVPASSTPETSVPETSVPETSTPDNTNNEDINSPQTADNSNIALCIVLLTVSAMCIAYSTFVLKKKNNEK